MFEIIIIIVIVVRFPITSPHFVLGLVRPKNCTKKYDTYLVTSDAFKAGHTQTRACLGVTFSAVLQVTVT